MRNNISLIYILNIKKVSLIFGALFITQTIYSQCIKYGPISHQSICSNQLPFSWEGQSYNKAGTYSVKINSIKGCDSINTLLLTLSNEWTGTNNNEWNNALNWSCNSVPDKFSDVVINSGNINITSNTVVNSLKINPSASLTIDVGINLNILDIYSKCIERYIAPLVSAHNISTSDTTVVNSLFELNFIDHSNLRYLSYVHDSVVLEFKGAPHDRKTIRVDKYSNGLRNMNATWEYVFIDNLKRCLGTSIYCYPFVIHPISSDTIPEQSVEQIRNQFIMDSEQFEQTGTSYKDSCLSVEFGYVTIDGAFGNLSAESVKAWRINSRNNNLPQAYYKDSDGSLIYYFDANNQLQHH